MFYEQLIYEQCDACGGTGLRERCCYGDVTTCGTCTMKGIDSEDFFFIISTLGKGRGWERKFCTACNGSGEVLRSVG